MRRAARWRRPGRWRSSSVDPYRAQVQPWLECFPSRFVDPPLLVRSRQLLEIAHLAALMRTIAHIVPDVNHGLREPAQDRAAPAVDATRASIRCRTSAGGTGLKSGSSAVLAWSKR